LRKLAAQRLAHEKPGQTLEATALVHEAYLRLLGRDGDVPAWENRRHFFAAAAEAMRRILVESARRKKRLRHRGAGQRVEMPAELSPSAEAHALDVLAIHEALDQLAQRDPETVELVKLHFFAGLTIEQAAELLGLAPRTAYRNWNYARAWLFRRLGGNESGQV
jgi:RNA polymerase sigma factor (TIGR02999 family)